MEIMCDNDTLQKIQNETSLIIQQLYIFLETIAISIVSIFAPIQLTFLQNKLRLSTKTEIKRMGFVHFFKSREPFGTSSSPHG